MLRIRGGQYRGKAGFHIAGTAPDGRRVRIFTETRASALAIKEAVRTGQDVTIELFRIPETKEERNEQ